MNKAEFRNAVLENMGIISPGEAPTYEDQKVVDQSIDSSLAELRGLGLAPFTSDDVPNYAYHAFRDYVCGHLAFVYGLPPEKAIGFFQRKILATQELSKQVNSSRRTEVTTKGWYF